MKEDVKQMLDLFFEKDETICVSPNEFGYHSVNQSDLEGEFTLVSPSENAKPLKMKEDDIVLMALNPINGFRRDASVTAFRSFLIELDDRSLAKQEEYVKKMGMPYSICVFSGNKSLHYGIVLDRDLPGINVWRMVNQWILNIMEKADQMTKNPSRSIRFPGNLRKDGKKQKQALIGINKRLTHDELFAWLNEYPAKKPEPVMKIRNVYATPTMDNIPKWVKTVLEDGIYADRNNTWFAVACAFASCNYEIEDATATLEEFFQEERDFSRKEWLICIKSAFKRVQD